MADNFPITPGTGRNAATDEVTYSGDTADVQLIKLVQTTGAEGAKTVVELPGDAANGLDVDVTRLPALVAGTANIGDVDVLTMPNVTLAAGTNTNEVVGDVAHDLPVGGNPVLIAGSSSAAAPADVSANGDVVTAWYLRNGARACVLTAAGALIGGDATNGLDADITRMKPDGTNTMPSLDTAARSGFFRETDGTLTGGIVDETGASAVDARAVGGGTPHDAVNSGNPLYMGAEAIAHGTNPTAVAAADRTKLYANRAGIPFVMGGHPNVLTLKHTTITTAVTDAAIITVGSGVKIVVTRITATLDNASTVFPTVLIGFGTANTPTTTGVLISHGGVPAGGGFNIGDGSGILGIGADNEDLRITTTGAATGNGLQICVSYYTIES